jgi:hypothetical protein
MTMISTVSCPAVGNFLIKGPGEIKVQEAL